MIKSRRVLIADDHAIFREGIKQVIARSVDMEVVDEAANGPEALTKVKDNDYDVVILDVAMPDRNGLDVLVDIKRLRPGLPVLILSSYPEKQYALRAYKSGADGYLSKTDPPQELLTALHKIGLGKKYISADLAEHLVASLGKPEQPHNTLSGREFQVLCMIASGKPVGKIADELSLSVKTITTHRTHILGKMNMCNNAELTRYAIEHHLV